MNSLTQLQKLILITLAVLDVLVIGGMATVVITSSRSQAQVPPSPSATTPPISTLPPTWTPTPTSTPAPTLPSRPTNWPTITPTSFPTITPVPPTETPTPEATPTPFPVRLIGGDFDYLLPNRIPGWNWDAYVNYRIGETADIENSYAEPLFDNADDERRQIDGNTLKVETIRWLKFRAWVYQTVTVTAGSQVQFKIRAGGYSSLDKLIVKAGVDPSGAENCFNAIWGPEQRVNQDNGTITLTSPTITVPPYLDPDGSAEEETTPEVELEGTPSSEAEATPVPKVILGRVTVCFFAEPAYPHINNAAFFDSAEIIVQPPR